MKLIKSFLLAIACCLLLAQPAWAANPYIEKAVLEVIQNHPEALLQSLATYQRQQQEQKAQVQNEAIALAGKQLSETIAKSPVWGNAEASRATVVEFADFECPYCVQIHGELKEMIAKHEDVAFVFKHLPLNDIHPQALPSATAAWAAGQQGKFWEFHHALFERKGELNEQLYQQLARKLKLNLNQFNRDRKSGAAVQAIASDMQLANRLEVKGTPFFLVVTPEKTEVVTGANVAKIESKLERSDPELSVSSS
jgi:protein-disulfide isomerase